MIDLWQQAERHYHSGTQPILLQLQAQYQLSVNLLLLALELDWQHIYLQPTDWQCLNQDAEQYESLILRPYRHIRQHIKTHGTATHYHTCLGIELILERALQQQLWQQRLKSLLLATPLAVQANRDTNLSLYLATRKQDSRPCTNLLNELAKLSKPL